MSKTHKDTTSYLEKANKVNPEVERFVERTKHFVRKYKLPPDAKIELEDIINEVIEESGTDVLTGLFNRQKMQELLLLELREFQRNITNVYHIMLLDIDGFREINGTYGEEVGDKVLAYVAKAIKTSLRETDIVGRWGGDEFLIILKDAATNINPKRTRNIFEVTLERLQKHIQDQPFLMHDHEPFPIILSYGSTFFVSMMEQGLNDADLNTLYEQIISEADQSLEQEDTADDLML